MRYAYIARMVTAQKIKTARDGTGESQEAFGKRFGVDQSTIHRWETKGPPDRGPALALIERVLADLRSARAANEVSR